MTKITFTDDKKQIRHEFLDLLTDTYNSMKEAKLSDGMVAAHLCGMAMAGEWFGVLDHDEVNSIAIALLIDTCEP